ncbi:MAG: hypothetical protein SV375_19540 [Thermodesulfobacteriota bacterium]|nr:hypothetical protein [Thermodesulfobacteriota bacterium]
MKDLFGNEVIEQKLIDRDVLFNVFASQLRGITEKELVAMLYSKYEAVIDYSRLCTGTKTGEKISMLFNPHRYSTATKNSKSIVDAFNDDSFLSGLARATLFKESKVKELLYQVLQLGINGVQYVNEFPPFIARNFYLNQNAKTILDPCAGWGGRMIGAASVGSFYHGFEPSTRTYCGLIQLGTFLKTFDNGFDFHIENIPFEDAELSKHYDFALTSPPYYDTEIYSEEETNSCNRYKNYSEWESRFYLPMVNKVLSYAKTFILNVGSRQYDLKTPIVSKFGAKEITSKLSGKGGLGRKSSGKEGFFLIQN